MFGLNKIGLGELIVILIIALVIFGPSKLPQIGRSMGEAIKEFKGSMNSLEDEIKGKSEDEKKEA